MMALQEKLSQKHLEYYTDNEIQRIKEFIADVIKKSKVPTHPTLAAADPSTEGAHWRGQRELALYGITVRALDRWAHTPEVQSLLRHAQEKHKVFLADFERAD